MKKYFDRIFFDKPRVYQNRIIALLLIIIGIILLYNPTNLHLKISTSMILIGFLFIFELNEKLASRKITGQHLTTIIVVWIFLVLIVSSNIEFDDFLAIVILGILAIKELLDGFLSPQLKKRMNVLFCIFVVFFAIIIGQRIINIIGI